MSLCCINVDIFLVAKYCILKWCNSFMQIVYCVYISFTEHVLGWLSPVLFMIIYCYTRRKMHTIDPNASQTHVLLCDFFKQLIWKSFY